MQGKIHTCKGAPVGLAKRREASPTSPKPIIILVHMLPVFDNFAALVHFRHHWRVEVCHCSRRTKDSVYTAVQCVKTLRCSRKRAQIQTCIDGCFGDF